MRKKITYIILLFALCIGAAKCGFSQQKEQERRANLDLSFQYTDAGNYCRLFAKIPAIGKTSFLIGHNVDGRGLTNVELTYSTSKSVYFIAGMAYHPYQNGWHPVIGLGYTNEWREHSRWLIEGWSKVLFDHMCHLSTEIETLCKISKKSRLGFATEFEYGKEFLDWTEAKKVQGEELQNELLFLVGTKYSVKVNDALTVYASSLAGKRFLISKDEDTIAGKWQIGLIMYF